jgi:hypothetical protein
VTTPNRLLFCDPDVTPGDQLHIGGTSVYDHPWREYTQPLIVIAGTEYSDYSGSVVEQSNQRVLLSDPEIAACVVRLIGSHGYSALAYQAYLGPVPFSDSLAESMEAMERYPSLDDEALSDLETEIEVAAWDDHGRGDFRKQLLAVLHIVDTAHGEYDLDDVTDEELDTLWHHGCDRFNVNGGSGCIHESGGTVHFYLDEWVDRATNVRRGPIPKSESDFRERLLQLALATRTK